MKKICTYLLCTLSMQLIIVGVSAAQEVAYALKAPAKPIVIDGNVSEWGDSLSYYNAESKIHYAITNDKYNLYLAIKTNDPADQDNILSSGVTLSLDPKGRKKTAFSVTFPVAGTEGSRRPENTLEAKKLRADLSQLRKTAVHGFNDITEDEINAANAYGIKTAMSVDDKGNLMYEEVIPLDLFHAGDPTKTEWTFNIKINGAVSGGSMDMGGGRPGGGGGAGGGAGGGGSRGGSGGRVRAASIATPGGGPRQEQAKSIDFWGKITLAK